jgi:hypothetical protein
MTSCSTFNSVVAAGHVLHIAAAGIQIQAVTNIRMAAGAAGRSHPAVPGREAAGEEAAVDIDHPAVGTQTGNRTHLEGHQGADHREAAPGLAEGELGHSLLRTDLPVVEGLHHDVRCLAHPWCRRRNR